MTADERQIRELVEKWAHAVHTGELETVLADHAEDIVMFDVPPPFGGVRGIDAYRETWPGFFEWQASGASFDLVSLDVTAGNTVAYAHAAALRDSARAGRQPGPAAAPHSRPAQAGRPLGGGARAPLVLGHQRHRGRRLR